MPTVTSEDPRTGRYEYIIALHVAFPSMVEALLDAAQGKRELMEYQMDMGYAHMTGQKPMPTENSIGWARVYLVKNNHSRNQETGEVWISPEDERGYCYWVVAALCKQQGEKDGSAQNNTVA